MVLGSRRGLSSAGMVPFRYLWKGNGRIFRRKKKFPPANVYRRALPVHRCRASKCALRVYTSFSSKSPPPCPGLYRQDELAEHGKLTTLMECGTCAVRSWHFLTERERSLHV